MDVGDYGQDCVDWGSGLVMLGCFWIWDSIVLSRDGMLAMLDCGGCG